MYYSGLTLYLEAGEVNDPEIKKLLITQSLRSLSDATFQIALTMQSDIEYLADGEYKISKGRSVDLIDSKMKSINHSFMVIHQASILRAAIYCNEGELQAMSMVFNEYSRFIENTVAENAGLLAQCDTADSGTERGVWKQRAKLKLDTSDFGNRLNAPNKVIYIGIEKEST